MTVSICEVGPRDGLQNEARVLQPRIRADLCRRLAEVGLRSIEAASFVRADLVPAMADPEEVFDGIPPVAGATFSGLVLNEFGYDRAKSAGVREVHVGVPVTDQFAARNQHTSSRLAVEAARRVVRRAHDDGIRVEICLIVAFGCPYSGDVAASQVLGLAETVANFGPDAIVLADTIGVAAPREVAELVRQCATLGVPLRVHLHNTRNAGYANAFAAIDAGATGLDASVGGVGGCPFAPGAAGNICTEDLVYALHRSGLDTGVDLEALVRCAKWLEMQLGHDLPGAVMRAGTYTT